MKRVVVLADAADDLIQAADFYDSIDLGVGDNFTDCLVTDLERLALFHGIHSRHFGFLRMLSKRFPFGIYYRETDAQTQVFAVLDLRRSPTWIRRELGKRGGRSK
jgi:hypothetical protein